MNTKNNLLLLTNLIENEFKLIETNESYFNFFDNTISELESLIQLSKIDASNYELIISFINLIFTRKELNVDENNNKISDRIDRFEKNLAPSIPLLSFFITSNEKKNYKKYTNLKKIFVNFYLFVFFKFDEDIQKKCLKDLIENNIHIFTISKFINNISNFEYAIKLLTEDQKTLLINQKTNNILNNFLNYGGYFSKIEENQNQNFIDNFELEKMLYIKNPYFFSINDGNLYNLMNNFYELKDNHSDLFSAMFSSIRPYNVESVVLSFHNQVIEKSFIGYKKTNFFYKNIQRYLKPNNFITIDEATLKRQCNINDFDLESKIFIFNLKKDSKTITEIVFWILDNTKMEWNDVLTLTEEQKELLNINFKT